jgi:PAS domain S-box-containing protein
VEALPGLRQFPLDEQAILLGILFDRMPMGVAIFDADFVMQRCNPTWAGFIEKYGPPGGRKVKRGMRLYECMPGNEESLAPLLKRIQAGESVELEAFHLVIDDGPSYWDIAILPILEKGLVRSSLWVFVDATQRILTIQELQAVAETLRAGEERFNLVLEATNDGIWDWDLESGLVYYSPRWKSMLGYAEEEISPAIASWRSLVHPDDLPRALDTLQGYLEGRLLAYQLEHRLRHKDGGYRWILTRAIALRDGQGNPRRLVGSHTDITDKKRVDAELAQAYQTLEQRVEQRTRALAALNAISGVANRSLDLQEILSGALTKTLEVMHLAFGLAFRVEAPDPGSENPKIGVLAQVGLADDFRRAAQNLPLSGAHLQLVAAPGWPVVYPVADYPDRVIRRGFQAAGAEQLVAVPLTVKDKLVGAMILGALQERAFNMEELDLLAAIGQQIGVAVENANLREQAELAAAIDERNRLARELHDSVTQSLYSVALYAEAANRLLAAGKSEEAAGHLHELLDTALEALREMRLLIFELRPPAFAKVGLTAALRLRLESVESRGGIQTQIDLEEIDDLPFSLQEDLYQVTTEALNNLLKHARARHVSLRLCLQEQRIHLEVGDDGVGFNLATVESSGGFGIIGMRERAQRLGGQLNIFSAPGQGTRVVLDIPYGGSYE